MLKRIKSTFPVSLLSEFSLLRKCEEIDRAYCLVCKVVFTIKYGSHLNYKTALRKEKMYINLIC